MYESASGQLQSAVPRHSEIKGYTVRSICKDLSIPIPKSVH